MKAETTGLIAPVAELRQLPDGGVLSSPSLWSSGPVVVMVIRRPG